MNSNLKVETISFENNVDIKGLVYRGENQILEGNLVLELKGEIIDKPTRTSIHIGNNLHIEDNLGRWVNHHCFPNTSVEGRKLIATKTLTCGDAITFDYLASEKTIANPFTCFCCNKLITK